MKFVFYHRTTSGSGQRRQYGSQAHLNNSSHNDVQPYASPSSNNNVVAAGLPTYRTAPKESVFNPGTSSYPSSGPPSRFSFAHKKNMHFSKRDIVLPFSFMPLWQMTATFMWRFAGKEWTFTCPPWTAWPVHCPSPIRPRINGSNWNGCTDYDNFALLTLHALFYDFCYLVWFAGPV